MHLRKPEKIINSIALSLLSCSMGCGYSAPPNIPPQAPNAVSLDPQNWYVFYSAGIAAHPSPESGGAWSFQFPSSEAGGHVNYVQTPFNATTTPSILTITFKVESESPQYVVLDPGDHPPATFRPFFEQRNDDLINPNGRWWADPIAAIYNLGSQDGQTLTFEVPLTSDNWSNVEGRQDPQAFSAALANVGWVGVTFGGQFFAGHGVALSGGAAKFTLINLSIN